MNLLSPPPSTLEFPFFIGILVLAFARFFRRQVGGREIVVGRVWRPMNSFSFGFHRLSTPLFPPLTTLSYTSP